jgi:AcrR family transcriptional regulator
MAQPARIQRHDFLQWVRPPQQERTRLSLHRMLDAAEALVASKGFDEASIIDIARRAGSSVGGFYRRFRDKDTLLHALHQRFCEEALATAEVALDPQRWVDASVPEIIQEFSAFLVQIYRERQGLFRAVLSRGPSDPTMLARTNQLFEDIRTRLQRLIEERRSEISHPDAALATRFGLHAMIGTLNHIVQIQPQALPLDDKRLAGELARAFVAYLGTPAPQSNTPARRFFR